MIEYVWLVPFLPLMAAVWTGLSGERLGEKAGLVAVGGIFSSFLVVLSILLTTVGAQSHDGILGYLAADDRDAAGSPDLRPGWRRQPVHHP